MISGTDPDQLDSEQTTELVRRARAWADADPDPVSRAELVELIRARAHAELRERMSGDIEFGTAGLRAIVGAGSARMNLAVVIRVTRALADHLLVRAADAHALPIVVGCDARLDSVRFADAAARVLLAAGFPVKRFTEPVPTPLVAYAVRELAAIAGIVITASHNPAAYNGYKLYVANGAQVIPPEDHEIAARMQAVAAANDIPLGDLARQEYIPASLSDRYVMEICAELPQVRASRELCVVYTPLHGVGAGLVERLFAQAGYCYLHSVPEQRDPNGNFPTLTFPNPEEPGALDLAIALATAKRADLVLANDPDADRLAVAVPTPAGGWLPLTGNQIGLLLADFALAHGSPGERRLVLSSVVSSPMLENIASAHGARCERVLTGFKWVWTAALALEARGYRFTFGYEEALGYSFGRVVRDKDGISAALAFAELAAEARAAQCSVLDRLHALYREHGLWVSVQHNVVLAGDEGAARILRAMQQALDHPPHELAGRGVQAVRDLRVPEINSPPWRGPTLLVELRIDGGRVFIRPSGTEPKLKIYVDLLADGPDLEPISESEEQALTSARAIAQALVCALGLDTV